jgi:L-seryl-tRNA(Ser) seleniumtransferase
MTLVALEAVLRLYRDERSRLQEIPALRMLTIPAGELALRARAMLRTLKRHAGENITLKLVDGYSKVGGGALPTLQLPTKLIAVTSSSCSAEQLEQSLRTAATPVIGRIAKDTFLLDTRTILDDDIPLLAAALASL